MTSPTLLDGPHTVFAVATDRAGNVSLPSATNAFTVDTGVPAAPVITAPTQGQVLRDPTPTITGTGEVGDTVTVRLDGTVLGTVLIQGPGTAWAFTPTNPVPDGPHTVSAVQTDPAGNVSPAASVGFSIDTAAPSAPVITAPTQGATVTGPDVTVTGTGGAGRDRAS